jgi:uroporphyrinogen decarboxylase
LGIIESWCRPVKPWWTKSVPAAGKLFRLVCPAYNRNNELTELRRSAGMTNAMSHKERIDAIVTGNPVDRPGVSMWGHFFDRETSAEGLAEAMLDFQREYDWDFVKMNPRASYHGETWGCSYVYPPSADSGPKRVAPLVKNTPDWAKIERRPIESEPLAEQIRALRLIKNNVNSNTYVIETLFNPISVLARIAESDDLVLNDLRQNFDAVQPAMEAVTETFEDFVEACMAAGADGLFFSTTSWASYDRLTADEYRRFARPYDLRVLKAAHGAPFNVMHICGSNNMLFELADYPVAAFNWASTDSRNPSLGEAARRLARPPIGGISHAGVLVTGTPEQVSVEAQEAGRQVGTKRWILGPGCTASMTAPRANFKAVREAVELL